MANLKFSMTIFQLRSPKSERIVSASRLTQKVNRTPNEKKILGEAAGLCYYLTVTQIV